MENLRRVVQALAFGAFLYLFALTIGLYSADEMANVLTSKAPIDTFFRIDPLLGLTTMVATRRIIMVMLVYGLPVVVLSALAGRFFCGWICPLGTTLDAADKVFFRKHKKAAAANPALRNVKYYVLAGVVVAAVFGAQAAYFFDPITIVTRAFTFSIFPVVTQLSARGVNLPLVPTDVQYFFRLNFMAAAMLAGIIALNAFSRRFWCRNLCPLGALLGVLSKVSIVRRVVKNNCIGCRKCIPDCKMAAICDDPTQYQAPECIYCYSCTPVCPTLNTRIAPSLARDGYNSDLDISKRRVLQAAGLGIGVALLGKTNAAAKTTRTGRVKTSSSSLIRPPGALPEDEFVARCVRCSECMKVCPTNGLQPAIAEAGFEGIWTPVLVPQIGECTRHCNLCSQVCSSQAIQPLEVAEKEHMFIGTAVIDRSQCIAWNSGKQCLVCDECCSYRAVKWQTIDGVRRPFVEEHKCVGCGICENVCPIQPVAAIRVFSFGDKRHLSREEQKAYFDQAPDVEQ